jgi:ATP-dependent Clp protease ATP-binding subunit ClpC
MARMFGAGGSGNPGNPGQGPVRRIDLTQMMTRQAQGVLTGALRSAASQGHSEMDALHLVAALVTDEAGRTLVKRAGGDPKAIESDVAGQLPAAGGPVNTQPQPSMAAQQALINAYQAARAFGSTYFGPEHLLLALTADQQSPAGRVLAAHGVTPEGLQADPTSGAPASGEPSSETPTLDQYSQDLTERAREGDLDPVIGRAGEIEQTVEVLARRGKNNPVLIGEAGVGKTAIVEGIAQRIADEDVPGVLSGKRLVQLEMSAMLAGTRYRGDFEERMTKVIDEIAEHSDELVVFIDELHTVIGAGGAEGAVDAGNMLKPRLARGELHLIGATTLDEYRKNIEKDAAFERRFQPVYVDEPSIGDTIEILSGLQDRYERHHEVRYTDEAVTAAVQLSARYITDRQLPDKAIDLIDQAGARHRMRRTATDTAAAKAALAAKETEKDAAVAEENYEEASRLRDEIGKLTQRIEQAGADDTPDIGEEVTAEEIAEVVSRATGIPTAQLTEAEKQRLARLESELHERVVGQDDAVTAIARAVRRSRSGMGDPNRPIGSFLFLGPTGVGKTELAKTLASSLFGDSDRMVRLDMSEFSERHTASRLFGAPPGYVGHEEAGQLTEKVRNRPYSVILLDEIEKAHPDVFNTLLQILDDGRLTDGQGRTVDFKNTVLIMTSNLGSDIISRRSGSLGFTSGDEDREETVNRDKLMGRLRDNFRPEFLNRVDEVVVFRKLAGDELHRITEALLDDSRERLGEQNIELELDAAAVDWIAERGHQPEFGARPLRRTIQREVDDRIADLLLEDKLSEGQQVVVHTDDAGGLAFDVTDPGESDGEARHLAAA